jgi:hypothetical protein
MFSLPSVPASQITKKSSTNNNNNINISNDSDSREVDTPTIEGDESRSVSQERLSSKEKHDAPPDPAVPPSLNYTVPEWSGLPLSEYSFDIIKNGTIISSFEISKEVLVCGKFCSP